MKYNFGLIIAIFLSNIGIAQTTAKFSSQLVREDFDYLYESLQSTHYNLFVFQSKKKYDSLYNQLRLNIYGDSLTQLQTVTLYQRLASFANTGHCEIDFPAKSYIDYAYAGGTVFPLELAFEKGKVYIRKNLSTNNSLTVGDEILRIDEKPIYNLQKSFYQIISAESDYARNAKLEFWSFPRLYYQMFGTKEEWEVQIKSQDKKIRNVLVKAISVIDFETKRNGELVNPQRAFRYYGKVAYLNPGGFSSSEADGEAVFKQFIDSVFMDLKLSGRRDLIIDLRNNPGGHNAYSDYLISYFATKPFKWYDAFTLKTSKILKTQTRLQPDTTDAYSRAILSNVDGKTFKYEFEPQNPVLQAKRFQGKVYVLVNRQTYSMAAVAASLIQDYNFGRIVGEETGDPPTLYASQFSYQLPKTGITVKVPKGYIVRPNGDRSFKRLKPDMIINDHLLDSNDEILNRLLGKLKTAK